MRKGLLALALMLTVLHSSFLPPIASGGVFLPQKDPGTGKAVISVVRFEDRSIGTKQYEPWRMGIPYMIMESPGIVPAFKVISREYMINRVLKEQEFQLLGATDPASAVKLGNLLNARYMVIGSFAVHKETLHINAKVLSVETGELRYQISARGPLDNFFELQNKIAVDITSGLEHALNEETREKVMKRIDTKVVNASLANYRGEEKVETITVLEKVKKDMGGGKTITELKKRQKTALKKRFSTTAVTGKRRKTWGSWGSVCR